MASYIYTHITHIHTSAHTHTRTHTHTHTQTHQHLNVPKLNNNTAPNILLHGNSERKREFGEKVIYLRDRRFTQKIAQNNRPWFVSCEWWVVSYVNVANVENINVRRQTLTEFHLYPSDQPSIALPQPWWSESSFLFTLPCPLSSWLAGFLYCSLSCSGHRFTLNTWLESWKGGTQSRTE